MTKKCNYNIEWRVEKNLVKYDEALKFMEQTAQEIIEEKRNSLIWVLEHYPVYTAGISAKDEDLLDNKNIEVPSDVDQIGSSLTDYTNDPVPLGSQLFREYY